MALWLDDLFPKPANAPLEGFSFVFSMHQLIAVVNLGAVTVEGSVQMDYSDGGGIHPPSALALSGNIGMGKLFASHGESAKVPVDPTPYNPIHLGKTGNIFDFSVGGHRLSRLDFSQPDVITAHSPLANYSLRLIRTLHIPRRIS